MPSVKTWTFLSIFWPWSCITQNPLVFLKLGLEAYITIAGIACCLLSDYVKKKTCQHNVWICGTPEPFNITGQPYYIMGLERWLTSWGFFLLLQMDQVWFLASTLGSTKLPLPLDSGHLMSFPGLLLGTHMNNNKSKRNVTLQEEFESMLSLPESV